MSTQPRMPKVEGELEQVTVAKAYKAEQAQVFAFWDELDEEQRRALIKQLEEIDFQLLGKLTRLIDRSTPPMPPDLEPMPALEARDPARRAALAELGWQALREGKVACLVVAGGQGTRLGWDAPKGTYPVGPVTGKSLFQLFAEQVLATGRRAGRPLPWYVLTSRENRYSTEAYFRDHGLFGLDNAQVRFLVQRDLPATDLRGKLLLAEKHRIATSPDGHGGVLRALQHSGALDQLAEEGVEHLFYYQVDNPLCRVADPVFLGAHIEGQADVSTKVVAKEDPEEKIGVLTLQGGRPAVIEYSELTLSQQQAREPGGALRFRAGNIAIHCFSVGFLRRVFGEGFELPYHLAKKKVPHVDPAGDQVEPESPNGCKFETFVFDILPRAERHVALEVDRAEEFEPLKNASGDYSPATVRAALSDRAARWLEAAGHRVPPGTTCEVSPLTALDPDELRERLPELPPPRDGALSL